MISNPCATDKPLRVGGIVTAPYPIKRDDARIREAAASEGKHGIVIVETVVDKSGNVREAQTLLSPPAARAVAAEVVRTWRFTPAKCNDEAVASIYNVSIEY